MATTTNWSITYPTTANNITPLATHFANLASSTDTAITSARNQIGRYTGTDAQRLALTTATGRTEGTEWYSTDTKRQWVFDGTNWLTNEPGLYVITPAAAPSGYTVASDGSLVATALSTGRRNFDGIFSSRFRNYRVEINLSGKANTSATSAVVGRIGSSDVSSSAHFWTSMALNGTGDTASLAAFAGSSKSTFSSMADDMGTINYSVLEIGTPFVSTEPTTIMVRAMYRGGAFGDRVKTSSLEENSSLTGLGINFGQTVASVRIRFYGYV